MNSALHRETLDLKAVLILTALCMLWGFNAVTIKISNVGIGPVFCAGIRSVIAALALAVWMKTQRLPHFPGCILDGAVVGVLKESAVTRLDTAIMLSVLFQEIVIAFITYLLWFYVVHLYPVSRRVHLPSRHPSSLPFSVSFF